jgi:histidinol-phosphatase (PHP family)
VNEAPRASYHTHNEYCDGTGAIEEVVQAAIAAGLTQLGISSHAPLPFETDWTMPADRLANYVREVRDLKERYRNQIRIMLGAEIDFIPDPRINAFQEEWILPHGFDYFVGSVHFLGFGYPPQSFDGTEHEYREILRTDYRGDVEAMVVDYYSRVRRMLDLPGVAIAGHLDLIKRWNADHTYFTGDEPWYRDAVEETLTAISAAGTIVELNTAGWHKGLGEPYPARWILERCRDRAIPIVLNSDSHTPGEVTRGFEEGSPLLADMRITPVMLR